MFRAFSQATTTILRLYWQSIVWWGALLVGLVGSPLTMDVAFCWLVEPLPGEVPVIPWMVWEWPWPTMMVVVLFFLCILYIHIYNYIYNCICIYTNICILHIHVDMQMRIKTRVPWTQTVGKRIFIPQTYGKIGFDQSPHVLSCATDAGISQPASP